ncbi:hypothetical protein [Sphingobium sp.]|uniref:hypothetical protein n=1 Tax=Sphingobium sp. TaxID=1912891 RepID=UPI0025D1D0F7|nr:hypothetical protein [Sphingobium sp.]
MDKNAVEALVSKFKEAVKADVDKGTTEDNKQITELNRQIVLLQAKSRDHTYDLVAGLVKLAEDLKVEKPSAGYNSFLAERGIVPPAPTDKNPNPNPYPKFVKAVFAEHKDGKWDFSYRSAEKYANHVRFLLKAKREGRIHGSVQDFIRNFSDAAFGNALDGIEGKDRDENKTDAQAKRIETVREKGRNAQPVAHFDDALNHEDGSVVMLWGRIVGGTLEVMNVEKVEAKEADSLFYKLGKKAA